MLLTMVLERALQSYLQWDPQTQARVAALSGKVVKMELTGWGQVIYLCPQPDGIRLKNHYDGEVHTTITGSPMALLSMGLAAPQRKAHWVSALEITGDIELAQTLSQIVQNCQVDWEEPLSRVTGDVLAHQIGNFARRLKRASSQAASQGGQNMRDYLQEELHILPPRQEIEDFYTDVYTLCDDVERLFVRVQEILRQL